MAAAGAAGERAGRAGHLLDGGLHVRRLDGLGAGAGGFDPGGAGQQAEAAGQPAAGTGQEVQGGRFDGLAVDAHGRQALLEILRHLGRGPGTQAVVAGNAREEGAMLAQAQGAQEVFVADEHQAESGRVGQVQPQEQAHFLQAAVAEALGFIQDDEGNDFAQFGQGRFDEGQVGFAAEGGSFAQFGGQGREQAAAA